MLLSMKWLSDYVQVNAPIHDFCEKMTMSGSKVESHSAEGEEISGVVVGKVLSVQKHPNADSLVICQVEVGKEQPVQIVTGAPNIVSGALVPVALDGATLPHGVTIKKSMLRGELSDGMLCSLGELGLTVHDFPYAIEDGIFLIEEECSIGQDIRYALGFNDTVVDFEITSNRPDCLSITGLAREAAATFSVPMKLPQPQVRHESGDIGSLLKVDVQNNDLCLRYIGRVVKNVKIGPSPRWMRERLRACGVRPINNIVDITNFVMLEYGQPMHAFDYHLVKGGQIVVRNAREGETITTLDGTERRLSPSMLVIADCEKPTAVAGVMGGEYSGIMEDTNTIVFESACFDGSSVRLTAKALGMRTESSARYEKGLDPNTCLPAVLRACELVEELGAGEVVGGMIDSNPAGRASAVIPFDPEWINRFLGIDLPGKEMAAILESIGFSVSGDQLTVPTWRADVECAADVAEEIARFYGYNRIPTTNLRGAAQGSLTPEQQFTHRIHQTLLAQGLSEIVTYTFISPKNYDKIELPPDSSLRRSLVIQNPLGEDTSIMRTTALPSLLDIVARNYNNRNETALLYEIGTEYTPTTEGELPLEHQQITLGGYQQGYDFFRLKGVVVALLEQLNVTDYEFVQKTGHPTFHPGRCAELLVGGERCGVLGEIHPQVAANYGVGTRIYAASLRVETLFSHHEPVKDYRPLPRFPASTRDLALLCDEPLPAFQLEKAIRSAVGPMLEKLQLFDVYQGAQIPAGKKSIAYSLSMRTADHTLTDEEADGAVKRALKELEKIGAVLRA